MREDSLKASVNYGDYVGTAEADRSDQLELHQLVRKYGIDTERYFVVGAKTYRGEGGYVSVSILAADTHVVKAASFQRGWMSWLSTESL